ncbi:MAG: CpsD/CapB family tyrosine-protein kinase [Proteobacteria bacterium]|nr:CpsD/CapB family tyrosine-protein kinase [Pseudomonadota bacterium]
MGKVHEALKKALKEENSGSDAMLADLEADLGKASEVSHGAERLLWNEKLLAANESRSEISENFRRLRTKILHPQEGRPPRVILVTSVAPGEGKSFVCANLGVTLATGLEQHALLVDCDLRRPTLAGMFGLKNDIGVVDHLMDGKDISHLIKKTSLDKLSIIPSGRPPVNPAEVIGSEKMVSLIEEVVNRYGDRYVLLDGPPMYAASETMVLAKFVDAIVLVVRWGVAGREQAKELIESLGRKKVIGIVFNAYEESKLGSKLSGYYYDQYTYGEEKK